MAVTVSDILKIVAAIILPPLGVFLVRKDGLGFRLPDPFGMPSSLIASRTEGSCIPLGLLVKMKRHCCIIAALLIETSVHLRGRGATCAYSFITTSGLMLSYARAHGNCHHA
jgi:hypothetical protein